jgi:hypothetical protein
MKDEDEAITARQKWNIDHMAHLIRTSVQMLSHIQNFQRLLGVKLSRASMKLQ